MTLKPKLADFDLTEIGSIIAKANKRTAENESRSFRRTTNNWKVKPTFNVVKDKSYYDIVDYKVVTNSEVYKWVDEGTEPHEIKPKNPNGFLRYQVGYEPKTTPNKIVSNGSGQHYGDWTARKGVMHSGIEARNFTEEIKKKAPDRWQRAVQTEIDKFVKGSIK